MDSQKKILFTTPYRKEPAQYYNWLSTNMNREPLIHSERRISVGLRFIKQNIPSIEILEYPTKEEFSQKLDEGYDVVGFSFFLNEVNMVKEMAELAREKEVQEIWGGNYGILTPGLEGHIDRKFIGYAEREIASLLGQKIDGIVHPPLLAPIKMLNRRIGWLGVLYTTRGCNMKCTFCQSCAFAPKVEKIPLENIENVLKYYKKMGVRYIGILDEHFGLVPKHAKEVIRLLNKYGFLWLCLARADFLERQMDAWQMDKNGLVVVSIGIESFNQDILDSIDKKEEADQIVRVIKILKKKNVGVVGFYMIGFDTENPASIKQDMKQLAKLKLPATQLCVLTPLPATPLWDDIEDQYGIFEKDYQKFDAKHLVWNHPKISPPEMEGLLTQGMRVVNPRSRFPGTIGRIMMRTASVGGNLITAVPRSLHTSLANNHDVDNHFF